MTATSGKMWRKAREEGFEIQFPSGNTAMIRPVQADFFLRVGRIPDALAPLMNTIIRGDSYKLEIPPDEELEKKREWVDFLNQLITYAFVTPKVVENPQADDEISIDDVSYLDKYYIYRLFTAPAEKLRTFRKEQTEPVVTVDAGSSNGRSGVPALADK